MNKINQGSVYDIKTCQISPFSFHISIKIKLIESSKGCDFNGSLLKHLGLQVKAEVQKGKINSNTALATHQCDLLHRKWKVRSLKTGQQMQMIRLHLEAHSSTLIPRAIYCV